MIEKIFIKNIGGIREANLNFTGGLNVITGESGAGKSSVVRAIELLTGTRGSGKFIRAGENSGTVEAKFTDVLISREINQNGHSRAKTNENKTSLNECSKIVNSLVRIQNQFAQIELLDSEKQLAMLDLCLDEKIKNKTFRDFQEIYDKAKTSANELRAIKKRRAEIERQYSNAKEIFELVKIAKPESGLEIKLENSLADLTHKISRRERAKENFDSLTGGL
ncbi:MAG: AAA family ATPase, partial [Synergistaceae bacterium]|nr:AAA family ATPase [Synergistaceae bacterium]